jgi:hypothetical protein
VISRPRHTRQHVEQPVKRDGWQRLVLVQLCIADLKPVGPICVRVVALFSRITVFDPDGAVAMSQL